MHRRERLVVVGGGHAGGRSAVRVRDKGYTGEIILIGEEHELPYERPLLSKRALVEDDVEPTRDTLYSDSDYAAHNIEIVTGARVLSLDLSDKCLHLARGRSLNYDKLLLTTGSSVRRLEVPGARLEGVCYLRTAADARALRERLALGSRVVIVGAGFIGLEVAAAAVARGCDVSVLETAPSVLGRMVGRDVADFVAGMHKRRGVRIETGAAVAAIRGHHRVKEVILGSGAVMPADTVVVGVGVRPNVVLAQGAGIVCRNGITVDEHGLTSAQDVFAAGDVANSWNPFYRHHLRLESWDNAQRQAWAVADNIVGATTPYGGVPWFWTDQYDLNLQILGVSTASSRTVTRGDHESASFAVVHLDGDHVVGAVLANRGRDRHPLKELIEERIAVAPAMVADEEISFKRILEVSRSKLEAGTLPEGVWS